MKIVSWNCFRGPSATRAAALESYSPDIVVTAGVLERGASDYPVAGIRHQPEAWSWCRRVASIRAPGGIGDDHTFRIPMHRNRPAGVQPLGSVGTPETDLRGCRLGWSRRLRLVSDRFGEANPDDR